MKQLKHIGRVKNTGRRCIVVFREIYDDKGNVVDENNCLVVETDTLPDAEHQDLMRIIESDPAQSTGDVFNVLARERLGSGTTALAWLAKTQRLRKFPTNNIELTPDTKTVIGLDTINKIVKMQKEGRSQEDIEKVLRIGLEKANSDATQATQNEFVDRITDTANSETSLQTGEGALDDAAIARQRLKQAEIFEAQAKELREQAYELDPSLKPARKRKTLPKKETPAKS